MTGNVEEAKATLRCKADIVVMNPPFGTRKKHADRIFLEAAFQIAHVAVYSLHKTSTRTFIESIPSKCQVKHDACPNRYFRYENVLSCQAVAQLRYDLPASYPFHKYFTFYGSSATVCISRSQSRDIEVDLWRFSLKDV